MMYELELRNWIKTSLPTTAVHWQIAPDHASYPMVLLHPVSGQIGHNMDGIDPINTATVQVDLWGSSVDTVYGWKNSLLTAIDGFEPKTTGKIAGIFVSAIRSGTDTSTEQKLFRVSIDIRVIGQLF